MEREGKKTVECFAVALSYPSCREIESPRSLFLSRSLFALAPRLADTVSDKNLGLRVNVGSQLFVFLYGLILWPKKR